MRNLKSEDIFAALNVADIIGAEEAFSALNTLMNTKGVTQEEAGTKILLYVTHLGNKRATEAFYEFLAGPLEKSVQELKDMDAVEFMEQIRDFVASVDVSRWKAFFTSLAGLVAKKK